MMPVHPTLGDDVQCSSGGCLLNLASLVIARSLGGWLLTQARALVNAPMLMLLDEV